MQYIQATSGQVCSIIAERLQRLLEQDTVAWFVSGGSNIGLQVDILTQLADSGARLDRLTVLLVDERLDKVGHADSNWQQLRNTGFFIDGPQYIEPYTVQEEADLAAAVERYEAKVSQVLEEVAYSLAQLGMGTDGHVAGIKPYSSAIDAEHLVAGYNDDVWQRMTVTGVGLRQIDEIHLVALGGQKKEILSLSEQPGTSEQLPVRLLRGISNVSVYTSTKN